MKLRILNEVRLQIEGATKHLADVLVELRKTEDLNEKQEVELATDVEYAIDKLRAVANLFRTRQDDRDDEEGEGEEGDEWKKRHRERE